ncbi:MAG TPA: SET domain-containing protein [Chitinophagaceae bacterium]|jgi:SET domain-containing protein|nr:SET domain-containing protein [Chitinophagaceae bacterium]
MNKHQLLSELAANTYVMLKPSIVSGIGVFAIRDIPGGCRAMFSDPKDNWIPVSKDEINSLPGHARQLVENYCVFDQYHYYVPDYGFKMVDLVNFLNHSDSPNVQAINDGEFFEAIADIAAGEELFICYGGPE